MRGGIVGSHDGVARREGGEQPAARLGMQRRGARRFANRWLSTIGVASYMLSESASADRATLQATPEERPELLDEMDDGD